MKKRDENYAFSSGVIRSNEKTLLSAADLKKVLEGKDLSSALSVLTEFGYGEGKGDGGQGNPDAVLAQETERVREVVFSSLPDPKELEFLLYPYDYHNLKVILKGEVLGTEVENLLTKNGSLEAGKLKAKVLERDFSDMTDAMRAGLEEALESYSKTRDSQRIDLILDKACYRDMTEAALELGSKFLTEYVELLVDLANVKTFVRIREIGKSEEFLKEVFLEGGSLDMGTLAELYREDYGKVAERLDVYGFHDIISQGASEVREKESFALLEKLCDNRKIAYLREGKYMAMGIEPAATFLLVKESEITNLRIILYGIASGISKEITEERLRETYV